MAEPEHKGMSTHVAVGAALSGLLLVTFPTSSSLGKEPGRCNGSRAGKAMAWHTAPTGFALQFHAFGCWLRSL